ncbi:MAG: hypothetical protein A3J97_05020 [Spirochaetes bacterium RIFOXYC1_FULL_54_7]|nr:MAG: hypothetical protein A3J97_05020 [Spirochaetes bacterium RIFOXYC1_FULL_54_7]
MTRLSAAQCGHAIAKGDFGPEVIASAPRVAVVLTQSWCPQWVMMRMWLDRAEKDADATVFLVEYDKEDYFEDFMAFKEDMLGNRSVPYIRYYRDGVFTGDGNFIGKDGFVAKLTRL